MTTEQAEISQGRRISGIWFIPLLALVLGLYMVVHNWMTEGPEIEIAFKTATVSRKAKRRSSIAMSIWAWWKKFA